MVPGHFLRPPSPDARSALFQLKWHCRTLQAPRMVCHESSNLARIHYAFMDGTSVHLRAVVPLATYLHASFAMAIETRCQRRIECFCSAADHFEFKRPLG